MKEMKKSPKDDPEVKVVAAAKSTGRFRVEPETAWRHAKNKFFRDDDIIEKIETKWISLRKNQKTQHTSPGTIR